jgi:uroporphyrinogen III methyltransferase/synthase
VTLIVSAGSAGQRVIAATASEAAAKAGALEANAVIVAFGTPDDSLRWFERRPLFGKRVLVTRAREQAGGTAALLREEGAEPIVLPTIEIRAPSDPEPLGHALRELRAGAYSWAVFTSANGVDRTWDALTEAGGDARAFGGVLLAAIGPATARALERHGVRPEVVAKEYRGEGLAEEILRFMRAPARVGEQGPSVPRRGDRGSRVLLARAAKARDALPEALRAAGSEVDVVAVYETHAASFDAVESLVRELEGGRVDAVLLTSSSTVDNLCDLLGARAALLGRARIACIGPVTADSARSRGLNVDVMAAQYTVPGLVRALADSYPTPAAPLLHPPLPHPPPRGA